MFTRLYIHIPFCLEKCPYCAFISGKITDDDLSAYHRLLLRELSTTAGMLPGSGPLDSIYFGGGTPSLMAPDHIAALIGHAEQHFSLAANAEITLEANPGTIGPERLKAFRRAGVNRLSLGIQSFDERLLRCLGRVHDRDAALRAFGNARDAGYENIGIDLMHSLPQQDITRWQADLLCAVGLSPEHLSVYGLSVDEGTPFARRYPEGHADLPDEDLSAEMFELADTFLGGAGYEHYEIANYARPGRRSRHNSGYWRRDGYLGLGVAAHSLLRDGYGIRYGNPDNLAEYGAAVAAGQPDRRDMVRLARRDAMAEFMFLGLRMTDGVSSEVFENEFGCPLAREYGAVVADLECFGLLQSNGARLQLTRKGLLLSNQVFARFLP